MAGGSQWHCIDEKGVVVSIDLDFFYREIIARRLALGPESLFAPAEEGYPALCLCFLQCLLIHIAQHEYLQCAGVLYHDRHQSFVFLKIDVHLICFFWLMMYLFVPMTIARVYFVLLKIV